MNHRILAAIFVCASFALAQEPAAMPDVPYVPTANPMVDAMLKLANVHAGDVVYAKNIGAYSSASAVPNFNGFEPARIILV